MRYTKYVLTLSFLILAGCESSVQAPVEELRPQYAMNHRVLTYTVRPGDTLYAIAFLYDQNASQLASLNHLTYPYQLRTGQILRLSQQIAQPRHQVFTHRVPQRMNWGFKDGEWGWPTRGQIAATSQNPIESKGLNIYGQYDAKDGQFEVGGVSIHNQMTPHGPDLKSYTQETSRESEKPYKLSNTLSFMLESNEVWIPTIEYFKHNSYQNNYGDCWHGFTITETGSES